MSCNGAFPSSRPGARNAAEGEEYGGGNEDTDHVQGNIIDVEDTTEYGLQQFDSDGDARAGQEGALSCGFQIEQGIEDAEGQEQQDVAQALGAEAAPKFQLQVVFKCEPVWGAAAGHVVEKPVVSISQYDMKQRQAQQAGEVTDKEGGQQRAAKREMGMPPPFDHDVKDAGEEREGKKLQEVAEICVKEEILE